MTVNWKGVYPAVTTHTTNIYQLTLMQLKLWLIPLLRLDTVQKLV